MAKKEENGWKCSTVNEEWKEITEMVDKALVKKEVTVKKWKIGMKRWWDKKCGKERRKVKNLTYEKVPGKETIQAANEDQ
uniref:Uncharacterized protein n=1 Tax=Trichogramma kaykai TaxID=54128 RepID=A0ABD2VXS3_9HYME